MDIWVTFLGYLFTFFGYCEQCCCEHSHTRFLWTCFDFSWVYTQDWNCQMVTLFNILRNCWILFQSSYTVLQSYQQYMRDPIYPNPQKCMLLSVFLNLDILVSIKWDLSVDLICIYLITNDFGDLVKCFFFYQIYLPSRNVYSNLLSSFSWVICFELLSCKSSLYILSTEVFAITDMIYKY